jgi:hypothetical protein
MRSLSRIRTLVRDALARTGFLDVRSPDNRALQICSVPFFLYVYILYIYDMNINHHSYLEEDNGSYKIVVRDITGAIHRIKANLADVVAYKSGELIQRAMPYLSADERELIISGIPGHIYDAITHLDEEPEEEPEEKNGGEWTSGRMFNDDDKI